MERGSQQPVRANLLLAHELIPADLGQDLSPDEPVQEPDTEHGPAGHGMGPVGHGLVRLAPWRGRSERNNEEEDVGGTEERGRGNGQPPGLLPVGIGTELQVHDTEGDDSVDDGQGVRNGVDDKVVGVTGGQGEDGDETDGPVEAETSEGSTEGLVGSPELGEGEDTLATKLLVDTTLREDDTHDVAKCRESDEDVEGASGAGTIDIVEENGSDERARVDDLLLGRGCKVGNVGEDVEDGNEANRKRSGNADGALGVFDLRESCSQRCFSLTRSRCRLTVVRIAITDVAPDYVVKTEAEGAGARGGALECVGEVVRLVDLEMAAEGDETGDNDNDKDDQLEHAQHVLDVEAPAHTGAMQEEAEGDGCETDQTAGPLARVVLVGGAEDVFAKHDGIAGCPAEKNTVGRVCTRSEEPWPPDEVLEVVLLAAVTGNGLESEVAWLVALTVPHTMYTHMPAEAMIAPMTHMISDMPTLPLRLKMVLGVANTLGSALSVVGHSPSTDHAVEDDEHGGDDANLSASRHLLGV